MATMLIPYLIAITLLTITPGLDTTLIIRTATLEGKTKAFQAALGINLGCIVWGVIVACGLGALLMTSDLAFNALKWIGAIYLAWLGLNLILKPRSQLAALNDSTTTQNWFIKGFWGNLLNPKVGIFYISFLPQFIPQSSSPVVWTMGLVMIHVVIGFIWSIFLISAMQSISGYLKQPKFIKYMDRITGSIFILFALKLALSKR
ncbi:LysE family translocator [Acinetobacter sp. C26M]|uniref:LysE family translocator n=1 Tax=unclassified Acinetobacter TaxID=196816 RepID=UPI001423B56B|nr:MULTISPECIES: LysE family translocator [unclassified Acinetobacter]NIE96108.1 LysE family translocator [Acinetobacter sp. Tr-809]USA47634.1 LysE family translocator [Acinetobacter sp. C26M]USA51115.1 LysE family translocator [Acinetobacter sp. C26G]